MTLLQCRAVRFAGSRTRVGEARRDAGRGHAAQGRAQPSDGRQAWARLRDAVGSGECLCRPARAAIPGSRGAEGGLPEPRHRPGGVERGHRTGRCRCRPGSSSTAPELSARPTSTWTTPAVRSPRRPWRTSLRSADVHQTGGVSEHIPSRPGRDARPAVSEASRLEPCRSVQVSRNCKGVSQTSGSRLRAVWRATVSRELGWLRHMPRRSEGSLTSRAPSSGTRG